jgi:hypothetical protein
MIVLNATDKSLQVLLEGAITTAQLEWTLSAVEMSAGFQLTSVIANDGVTNGTTAVEVLAAPAATSVRQVKLLTVYNADTVAAVVVIRLNHGGAFRRLARETLAPGETLHYVS